MLSERSVIVMPVMSNSRAARSHREQPNQHPKPVAQPGSSLTIGVAVQSKPWRAIHLKEGFYGYTFALSLIPFARLLPASSTVMAF